ncbi:MAG: substrate-binding domain-containing protein, partial [Propionicimonas sp.]|nr:substrate-binding domain-containing protein [Propionicimonas sp.]
RVDGYRTAMNAARLPIDPGWIHYGDFHVDGGSEHDLALLRLPEPPTAVFAGSDLQALGVYEACRSLGLRIPEDLSVIGYDDLAVAQWVSPRLTTVHQPLRRMGAEAARIVINLARRRPSATPRIDLATHLVVRESTAVPA